MAVDNVGMDVPIKFGDSRSKGFRDIRGAHFVLDERMNEHWPKPIPISQRVSPKNEEDINRASAKLSKVALVKSNSIRIMLWRNKLMPDLQ